MSFFKLKFLELKYMFLAVLMVFCYGIGIADGPPIKDGKISVPHQSITLSNLQVHQAGTYRYIKLEDEQIKQLQKLTDSSIPPLLYIITAPYNDCACGLEFYGLWVSRNEVQIPDTEVKYLSEYGFYEKSGNPKYSNFDDLPVFYETFHIDYYGNIFQAGEKVSDLSEAYERILENDRAKKRKSIWIETPPLNDRSVVQTTKRKYSEIKEFFLKKGFEVYAYFETAYYLESNSSYKTLPVFHFVQTDETLNTLSDGCSLKCGAKWDIAASSTGKLKGKSYNVKNINDTSVETVWVEGVSGFGVDEEIVFSNFSHPEWSLLRINGFVIHNGFVKSQDLFRKNARVRSLILYENGKPKYYLKLEDIQQLQKVTFPTIIVSKNDVITLRIDDFYGGNRYQDTVITTLMPLSEY